MFELLLSLFALICAISTSLYAIREMKVSRALITEKMPHLEDYIQKGKDGTITMREDIAMVIDAFGSRIAKSLKMSFLQGLGAQAKIDNGLKGAMMEGVVQNQMPILGLLGDIFGIPVEKYLRKHPEAIMQLAPMGAKLMGGGKGGFDLSSLIGGGSNPRPQGNDGVGYK